MFCSQGNRRAKRRRRRACSDLLFYHRRLRCLIAVDLKIGAFQPEHAGKMNFYFAALDDTERQPGDGRASG